ncbi:MAG: alpha/beta hydrolase [Candidatus Binatia bacterium]
MKIFLAQQSRSRVAALALAGSFASLFLIAPPSAFAVHGECSQPVSNGDGPAASDCLRILQVAVGSASCSPECLCAPLGGENAAASDALVCLKKAVGQNVPLACACSFVRVHYPAGERTMSFRARPVGSGPTAGPGTPCTEPKPDLWICNLGILTGEWSGKPRLDDDDDPWGANWNVHVPGSLDVFPFYSDSTGRVEILPAVASPPLATARNVAVYLPPSYDENTAKDYPILFMQDGQDLFDAALAFGGVEWQADEAMLALARDGSIVESIIVAPYSTAQRIGDYTPTHDPGFAGSGNGDLYLDFLLDELAPKIASMYRVDPSAKPSIAGASLGALVAAYGAWTRWPEFRSVAALSPSLYWDNEYVNTLIADDTTAHGGLKIYLDVGDAESAESVELASELSTTLQGKGWEPSTDLLHLVVGGGQHNNSSWAQRLPIALAFILQDPDRIPK